jgi:DNA-binding PadR family transcriptional regulator
MSNEVTNAEYAILGLLMERPCHGYDLDRTIQERGMREWTELAFSSIYFILKKLEKRGFVESRSDPQKKTRKIFSPTASGRQVFHHATVAALAVPHSLYPSVLLGLSNWPTADSSEGLNALQMRLEALREISAKVEAAEKLSPPLPYVAAVFDYSLSQLRSEIDWVKRTIKLLGGTYEQD